MENLIYIRTTTNKVRNPLTEFLTSAELTDGLTKGRYMATTVPLDTPFHIHEGGGDENPLEHRIFFVPEGQAVNKIYAAGHYEHRVEVKPSSPVRGFYLNANGVFVLDVLPAGVYDTREGTHNPFVVPDELKVESNHNHLRNWIHLFYLYIGRSFGLTEESSHTIVNNHRTAQSRVSVGDGVFENRGKRDLYSHYRVRLLATGETPVSFDAFTSTLSLAEATRILDERDSAHSDIHQIHKEMLSRADLLIQPPTTPKQAALDFQTYAGKAFSLVGDKAFKELRAAALVANCFRDSEFAYVPRANLTGRWLNAVGAKVAEMTDAGGENLDWGIESVEGTRL